MSDPTIVIGLDFGTDSCRALAVRSADGAVLGDGEAVFRRWSAGTGCDAGAERFRQHPLDHIEALREALSGCLAALDDRQRAAVAGLGVASTASSPLALDRRARPLALDEAFAADPDAWLWLWKDHTALDEAGELAAAWHAAGAAGGYDCTASTGGDCSPEWYWPKRWCLQRRNPTVAAACAAFVEHADWIPALLGGVTDADRIARNRCCAGHKAQWDPAWGGPPPAEPLAALDPALAAAVAAHPRATIRHDRAAGGLGAEWAAALGLRPGIAIAGGLIDAHAGALGAGGGRDVLVKVVGTSNCDLLLADPDALGARRVLGISGQVRDAVLPGLVCLEAGQAAFGDALAWFADLLRAPLTLGLAGANLPPRGELIAALTTAAVREPWGSGGCQVVDWFNGRRTPDPDPRASATISGLRIGTTAPRLFRALLEGLMCGTRAIHERFVDHGVAAKAVIALGGIAHKSPEIMQLMSDVLDVPISVAGSHQAVALGAAMNAACAAGLHADLPAAQAAMTPPMAARYRPDPTVRAQADAVWERYRALVSPA